VPSTQPARTTLLTHATIHTVSGATIEDGSLLLSGGKISAVGKVDAPSDALVIDCTGKHIYPGLIDSADDIGLTEIDSVRGSRDVAETGQINPNARTQVAINPDSELIPTTRSNGVLVAHVMSEGGLLAGTSAVMMLDGWTWEEMTLVPSAGVTLNFPNMSVQRSRRNTEDESRQLEARDRSLLELDRVFDDARAYALTAKSDATTRAANFDARWEAMKPVLDRSIPLYIRAEEMGQINAALAFAKRQNVRCVIVGGRDADRCTDLLKAMDVPVIITGTHRLPGNADDAYDSLYALPAKLKAAGVRFSICSGGWTSLVRNLPYQAASAIAFDLSREDALKSITLWPAQILGVDSKIGSIETGKDATLIIADGDILEIPTHVERAYVQGREVDLNDRHKMLRDKYQKRIDASTQPTTKPS
jgi:imidazolonepropionase-like amidohydrolase